MADEQKTDDTRPPQDREAGWSNVKPGDPAAQGIKEQAQAARDKAAKEGTAAGAATDKA